MAGNTYNMNSLYRGIGGENPFVLPEKVSFAPQNTYTPVQSGGSFSEWIGNLSKGGGGASGGGAAFAKYGGAAGGFASMLGAKGGAGTGGSFTSMGAMTGNPYAVAVGLVLDLTVSSSKAKKAEKEAKKAAAEFWKNAQIELGQMKKRHVSDSSETLAQQGATGVRLDMENDGGAGYGARGTVSQYRATQNVEQDIEYRRTEQAYLAEHRRIRKSGGKGGLF